MPPCRSGDDVAKFIGAYQKENGCVSNQTSKDQRLEIIFPTQQQQQQNPFFALLCYDTTHAKMLNGF